jgi:HSP20 family protein
MYRTLFPRELFTDFDRLSREVSSLFDLTPSIRGLGRGGYPALNVGVSPSAVEVFAFAPGLDPATIEVNLERGVLSLAGERQRTLPESDAKTTVHQAERFAGRFRRVVSLPDDIDADSVEARYTDGVLRVTVARREPAQARRIAVQ